MKVEMGNGTVYERHYSFNGLMSLMKRAYGKIGGENPAVVKVDGKFYYIRLNASSGKPYFELDGEYNE